MRLLSAADTTAYLQGRTQHALDGVTIRRRLIRWNRATAQRRPAPTTSLDPQNDHVHHACPYITRLASLVMYGQTWW
jgi:hypothetical protein